MKVQESTLKYKIMNQNTDLLYLEVYNLEQPIEFQLGKNLKM